MTAQRELTLGDYFERIVCMVRELRAHGYPIDIVVGQDGVPATPVESIVFAIVRAREDFDLREAMKRWIARVAAHPAHRGKWRDVDGIPADPRGGA